MRYIVDEGSLTNRDEDTLKDSNNINKDSCS